MATLLVSASVQVGALYIYNVTHPKPPPPPPLVKINVSGYGTITSNPAGFDCGFSSPKAEREATEPTAEAYINGTVPQKVCRKRIEVGSKLKLVAIRGKNATFEGWSVKCGLGGAAVERSAYPSGYAPGIAAGLLPWAMLQDEQSVVPLRDGDPMECTFVVKGPMEINVKFGMIPRVVQLDEVKLPEDDKKKQEITVTLPDAQQEAKLIAKRIKLPPKKKPKKKLAKLIPKTKKKIKPIPKPKPKKKQVKIAKVTPKKKKLRQPKSRMKSVEVPDKNEVKKAPDDAKFLSDKNRDVKVETRARDTNLEKQLAGKTPNSEKSNIKSEQIGGKKKIVAQLEKSEPSSLNAKRTETTAGKHKRAQGVRAGTSGGGGEGGQGGDLKTGKKSGLLSMRNLKKGIGLPGGPLDKTHKGHRHGRPGKRGKRGLKTSLNYQDYERIVGKKVARLERQVGKRKMSMKRGRWARKRKAIMASLENFNSEVRPGNQTALKTRAAPFAVYIARMHRKIHELWGFGFLEDLNDKGSGHPLNNMKLWTDIEIVVNSDGTIHKTTIIRNSGRLEYDVAALDVIYSGAPYNAPPRKIRSPDGRVYIHWSFHRNHRQCGTFNARPYILAKAPKSKGIDDGKMLRNKWKRRKVTTGKTGKGAGGNAAAGDAEEKAANNARAHANMATPDDPNAKRTSALWVRAFAKGDIAGMAAVSGSPFRSRDRVVANSNAGVQAVYKIVLAETKRRQVLEWKVFSPAQFRRAFGRLPPGLVARSDRLLLVVRVPKERFTLELSADGKGGYKITGFHR